MYTFAALNVMSLLRAMPGAIAQGMVWGIMGLGVYITFRLLDFADLTVDGSLAFGAAVCIMLIRNGFSPVIATLFAIIAGMTAGLITGLLHTLLGIRVSLQASLPR